MQAVGIQSSKVYRICADTNNYRKGYAYSGGMTHNNALLSPHNATPKSSTRDHRCPLLPKTSQPNNLRVGMLKAQLMKAGIHATHPLPYPTHTKRS